MLYNSYFNEQFCTRVFKFLKEECKIDKGFYSQIVGKKMESATTSSIVYYVLNKLGQLSFKERQYAIAEILSFKIVEEGFYKNAIGIFNDITTWGTAQACLALIDLGATEEQYIDTLLWLCSVQHNDGGWSYDGYEDSESHIIYSFYTLLSLKRYSGTRQEIHYSIQKAKSYLENCEIETVSEMALKFYLIDVLNIRKLCDYEIITFKRNLSENIIQNLPEDTITESSLHGQGHFYINFYFNSYYLLLRKFCRADDYLCLYIIKQIKMSIRDEKGWPNKNDNRKKNIYSWATALAMLSICMWNYDCVKQEVDEISIVKKISVLKKEDLKNMLFMQKCPLNGGECNLVEQIKQEYSNNKIFLDIPYAKKYRTFEKQIIETLTNAGLEVVEAKQQKRTKMILCKICYMLQTCKYGVADLSYESLNVPFELGLIYGLGKDCAILKSVDASQPTDIEGIEYIEYENTDELDERLGYWIKDNVI